MFTNPAWSLACLKYVVEVGDNRIFSGYDLDLLWVRLYTAAPDFANIDANKANYPGYADLVLPTSANSSFIWQSTPPISGANKTALVFGTNTGASQTVTHVGLLNSAPDNVGHILGFAVPLNSPLVVGTNVEPIIAAGALVLFGPT